MLLKDEGPLEQHATLEKAFYDLDMKVKRLLYTYNSSPPTPENTRVKLPKIDVRALDGNIFIWNTFWEQFEGRKLAYLRHALKGRPAKQVTETFVQ